MSSACRKTFPQGRTLYIDNFYTSYELAISCLNRKTHVVGTLRNNKKFLPKDILHCKLRKGEMVSKEDDNEIVVLKWRDTRDVRILSTKHAPIMVPSTKKNRSIRTVSPSQQTPVTLKPLAVVEYNAEKCDIDYSEWFLMPPQLEKESSGTESLAFNYFWEFLL